MKNEFYSETSRRLLYTIFDDSKQRKTNAFRVHHHTELELGYMVSGEGVYILNNTSYEAKSGDLFLVRTNEQHCVPTIYTDNLVSFNIHISSYYLWSVCSEYIEPERLRLLIGSTPITHRFTNQSELINRIQVACRNSESGRFKIRRLMLELLCSITDEFTPEALADKDNSANRAAMLHMNDIQNAIAFINEHLTEPITLDQIARCANMSRSHLSAVFKHATGITPYEYLLLQRIERAAQLLRHSGSTILVVSQECGFCNLANFNKSFKNITGMTPTEYRQSKQKLS